MHTRARLALCCFFFLAIAAVVPCSVAAAKNPAAQTKRAASAQAVLRDDPELARAESAFTSAREKFLAVFSGTPKPWAERLLSHADQSVSHTFRYLDQGSDYARQQRATFLAQRAAVTRYMELVAKTPYSDPAFLILARPVCRSSSYASGSVDLVANALAEYDAYVADPEKPLQHYATRRVNDQYWGAILFPETLMDASSGNEVYPAFVLRVLEGAFTLTPIIAPVREEYYKGEKSPLQPEKHVFGPEDIRIRTCQMHTELTIINTQGPFAFRADARQKGIDGHISYICEPKCTGFTYFWDESAETFIRRDGVCRDDDGWKPASPFVDASLVPVANFSREVQARNAVLERHEKAVAAATTAFLDIFEGAALEEARTRIEGWLFDRQFPLYSLVGKEEAFVAMRLQQDAPVLAYLQTVVNLVQNPDARLVLLLSEFAASLDQKNDRAVTRRPRPSDLLRSRSKPAWFVGHAQRQNALLAPPQPSKHGYPTYAAEGLESGNDIIFTYTVRAYGETKNFQNTYRMRKGTDNAFWGYAATGVGRDASGYERMLDVPRQYIMRIAGGTVRFVTPPLPDERDFFTNPKLDRYGNVIWSAPGRVMAQRFCDMAPAFSVDTTQAPFGITARNEQRNAYYFSCVPECVIPYAWDGSAYVKGAPECLPQDEWGIFPVKPKTQ